MFTYEMLRNLELSELQKKVDDLTRLYNAAVELRATNQQQLKWGLDRANKKFTEATEFYKQNEGG